MSVCLCKQHLANISTAGSGKAMPALGHTGCLLCQPGRAGAAGAGLGEAFRRKAVQAALITAAVAASPAETSPGCASPASSCLFALCLVGTEHCWGPQLCCLQCPTHPSTGKCSLGLHSDPGCGSHAQGHHGSVRAAAGIAPGKLVHFWNLACPPAPFTGAPPFSEAACHPSHPCLLCSESLAAPVSFLCPWRREAFGSVEHGKGRARQQQPPRGLSVAVPTVLPKGFGSLQRAQDARGFPGGCPPCPGWEEQAAMSA